MLFIDKTWNGTKKIIISEILEDNRVGKRVTARGITSDLNIRLRGLVTKDDVIRKHKKS